MLSNAFIRKEIKSFSRKIDEAGKVIKSKKDKIESLLVEVQKLSSEDRIVKIAQDSLGLIRSSEDFDKIAIEEYQLKQIEKIINSKYD